MDTNTSILNSGDTLATLPISYETQTYGVFAIVDEKGDITKKGATTSEKQIAALETPEYIAKLEAAEPAEKAKLQQLVFKQAVKRPIVKTLAGFDELYKTEQDKLYIINRGLEKVRDAKVRTVLTETNEDNNLFAFEPQNGVFDLTSAMQDLPQNVKQSAQEKALATLKASLPADMFAMMVASLQAAAAQSANASE